MADIFFQCPECDGQLVVDDRGAGMQLPCPFCSKTVTIPHTKAPVSPGEDLPPGKVNGAEPEGSKQVSTPHGSPTPVTVGGKAPSQRTSSSSNVASPETSPVASASGDRAQVAGSVTPDHQPVPAAAGAATPQQAPTAGSTSASPKQKQPTRKVSTPPPIDETEDPAADLEWDEDALGGARDPVEIGQAGDRDEIRRLAAMMNPEDSAGLPEISTRSLSFRCPSCGQVLTTKRAHAGDLVKCKACGGEFNVPEVRSPIEPRGLGPARESKGELPSGRNRMLRTADDIRGKDDERETAAPASAEPAPAPAPAESPNQGDVASVLTPEVQALLLKELQRLQAAQKGQQRPPAKKVAAKKKAVRHRPPPPLAQHGEVVAVPQNERSAAAPAPQPKVETRIRPTPRELPELVTVDTIELDSDVARQWGEAAVVPTRTLNWVSWLVILWIAGLVGYFAWDFYQNSREDKDAIAESEAANEEEAVSAQDVERARDNQKAFEVLKGFLQASTPEEKAEFVRNPEQVLPQMERHYKFNSDPKPDRIKSQFLEYEASSFGQRLFKTISGSYEESSTQINTNRHLLRFRAHLENLPDGTYLLDWPSFAGYNPTNFASFVKRGPVDEPQVFRLWVNKTYYRRPPYTDAARYTASYQLQDYLQTEFLYGFTEVETPAAEELGKLFSRLENAGDEIPKVRLMLKLRFAPGTGAAGKQVLIDELVETDWVETESTAADSPAR